MFATIRRLFRFIVYSIRAVGPRSLLRNTLRMLADVEARRSDSGFDARYGTETTRGVTPLEAGMPRDRAGVATMYLPTTDRDLETMLGALAWPEARLAEATFVDIGSGKGRVVFLAAMRRFREVLGIELAPSLHATAERNLEIMRATGALASPARLVLGDAADLKVPRGPCVFYLYHPFRAAVARVVVARIVAALAADPRPAAILYGHPTLQTRLGGDVFGQRGVFDLAAEGERQTAYFRIGWTIWTNEAWLAAAGAGGMRVA